MTIICWGNLAKSADDTQRIEESIQAYIEDHDSNPNAHMGDDYSLGAHRLQTELDHPPNSINYWHVKDIHAEAITAGGFVCKGNGPYISVQDDEGAERVKVYPEGIIVKKGKIAVQNNNDETILDEIGLKGNNIFINCQKIRDLSETIRGDGDWYFISPFEFGMYLKREMPIMFFGNIIYYHNGGDSNPVFALEYSNFYFPSDIGWLAPMIFTHEAIQSFSFNQILKLSGGYNRIRLLFQNTTSDGFVILNQFDSVSSMGYMVLSN